MRTRGLTGIAVVFFCVAFYFFTRVVSMPDGTICGPAFESFPFATPSMCCDHTAAERAAYAAGCREAASQPGRYGLAALGVGVVAVSGAIGLRRRSRRVDDEETLRLLNERLGR